QPQRVVVDDADPELLEILRQERDRMTHKIDVLSQNRDAITRYVQALETAGSRHGTRERQLA
ncbi:MAG: MerR family transcriptional regulator, partial [Micrococcaceae bacterium]|nr:MerR family transcriptional regulator [Micrococcaceae bacterium]